MQSGLSVMQHKHIWGSEASNGRSALGALVNNLSQRCLAHIHLFSERRNAQVLLNKFCCILYTHACAAYHMPLAGIRLHAHTILKLSESRVAAGTSRDTPLSRNSFNSTQKKKCLCSFQLLPRLT